MRKQALAFMLAIYAIPAAGAVTSLDRQFDQTVRPFVTKYCAGCHSGQKPAGQFDLKAYTTLKMVTDDFPRWSLVLERLTANEMPPKPLPPPPAEARQPVIDWIRAVKAEEIKRYAGDPGLVLARRLNNAEYNYTIRDLTGEDMELTKEFPVDHAKPAGFVDHVTRAVEQISTGGARRSRPHGSQIRWHRLRVTSHARRDGSRQVLHSADR
jgi:hypothetical protein